MNSVEETSRLLLESGVAVVQLKQGLKKPVTDSDGSWQTISDPDDLDMYLEKNPRSNIGIALNPKYDSPLVAIDIDGITPATKVLLQKSGVTNAARCWAQRSGGGRGHFHLIFYHTGPVLTRITNKPDGLPIDCLSNGYAVIAPSNTSREPGGGGQYEWLPGHSPWDIDISELADLPDGLVEWWIKRDNSRKDTSSESLERPPGSPIIAEGARNSTLISLAGTMRRRAFSERAIEAALLVENAEKCLPPLDFGEVRKIAESASRYQPATTETNYRGVAPFPLR